MFAGHSRERYGGGVVVHLAWVACWVVVENLPGLAWSQLWLGLTWFGDWGWRTLPDLLRQKGTFGRLLEIVGL